MTRLALYVLGPVQVERDGIPVTMDTRKAVALLVYLMLTGERHSRDTLAGLLWPDYDQAHARATLRRTLSALKEAITAEALDIAHDTIALAPAATIACDVTLFRALLASCAQHGHTTSEVCARCVEPLEQAAALYRGDLLAGFSLRDSPAFDDWQFFQQESLRRDLAGALERLARAYAGRRAWDEAIAVARRRLSLDRLHEPAHRLLMQLYARAGQRTAALRQYRDCVQVLDHELGVAPLEATTRLYEAIREHKTESGAPSAAAGARTATGEPPPTTTPANLPGGHPAPNADPHLAPSVTRTSLSATLPPLVGRAQEWAELERAYHAARVRGQVIALEGEAGIGKTRLAEELLARARRQGAIAVVARSYAGEMDLAYAPVVAALRAAFAEASAQARLDALPDVWLAEAARLAPELALRRPGLVAAPPLETPGAQLQFFEGLLRVFVAACEPDDATPGILFFDDLQWADSASLDALSYLARRASEHHMCLLYTRRDEEAAGEPRLRALIADARRAGNGTVIALERLAPADRRTLVRARLPGDAAPPDETITRLCDESEGLPLFLVEYVTALAQGVLRPDAETWTLPGGARDLLRSRLGVVSETGWQILTTAAVIGRSFDLDTLREVSGRGEEETVAALEELAARGLIHEAREPRGSHPALGEATPRYDFIHEKLRALVYDEASLARRRLLHRRVAESLAARTHSGRDAAALAGQIASHYLKSGNEALAATYYVSAGERARLLFANREALSHFQTALALGHPEPSPLHQRIGDLHTLLGNYPAALASYETAAALGTPGHLPAIEHKLGGVYIRLGQWERAETHLDAALDALEVQSPPKHDDAKGQASRGEPDDLTGERARIAADMSLVAHQRQRPDEALRHANEALHLAKEARDPLAEAQAHNMLGMLASGAGQLDDAIAHLEQSLALAEDRADPAARVAALNSLALAYAAHGDTPRAQTCAEAALTLAAQQGDRHREAALHNNLADIFHHAGQTGAAMDHLKQAVAIYAEIGGEAGDVQPEIWKLVEW